MGKVNKQLPFMCGKCKTFFGSEKAVKSHATDMNQGHRVAIYREVTCIDLRNDEPSFADRAIEASMAIAAGQPTDDAWLLGE
jgi:hypothetical protein